ncbi:MAG TPA: V-type ATP synthase subunit A, partial [Enterococcus aquimarinus]|nr:V-type ATP synthase subunit A [Enterococcus aquimarinus]
FLQQNAFDEVDTYTSREKQFILLRNILFFYHEALRGIALGAYFKEIIQGTVSLRERLARSKYVPEAKLGELTQMEQEIKTTIQQIVEKGGME